MLYYIFLISGIIFFRLKHQGNRYGVICNKKNECYYIY